MAELSGLSTVWNEKKCLFDTCWLDVHLDNCGKRRDFRPVRIFAHFTQNTKGTRICM